MKPILAALLALSTTSWQTASGQGPVTLLADVETSGPIGAGAFYEPHRLEGVTWNSLLYFAADADGHGKELWRTNGAVGSAELVADIRVDGGSDPELIGVLGGWLLLVADDGVSGRELWRTDGTAAGTSLVRDIAPGSNGSDPSSFVHYGNWYYFLANQQLWQTDGQTGNTFAVSPTIMTGVYELVAAGSQLFMAADDNGTYKLWASTGNNSVYFVDNLPDEPVGLTGLPGIHVVFSCDDGSNGRELWHSNGTVAGTQMLVDLVPGNAGSYPSEFAALNNLVYFRAHDGSSYRLWRSDGTVAGTWVIDTANGPRFLEHVTAVGNRLMFRAQNSSNTNSEPWVSDGTAAGTWQIADIWPGNQSSGAAGFAYDGTQWTYFSAHDGTNGYELWRTDAATTQRVSDIQPGNASSSPTVLGFVGVYCVFAAVHPSFGAELFSSQGNGSFLTRDLRNEGNGSSDPEAVTPLWNGSFWFTARRPATGREPHFSSGLPGSGQLMVDTVFGATSGVGYTTGAASHGDYVFFNSMPGAGLWRTAGTVPSTNAIAGAQCISDEIVEFAGRLYFEGRTAATGDELFVIPSPLAAPTLVKDIMPGTGGDITELTVVGNRLFFFARDPQSGAYPKNLWVSEGTTAGTQQVYVHGSTIHHPRELRALGRRAIFSLGNDLVISDGTAAGTGVIGQVYATEQRVVVGNRMFFAGEITASGTGEELCITDGSTVTLVKDIRPGAQGSRPYGLCAFGNGILFLADDGTHGTELWRSDGTTAGTTMVLDLRPGPISGCPPQGSSYTGFVYAPAGAQRAVFAADDGATGFELWRTDGTAAGTTLHADIQPGRLGSWPSRPQRCGVQLVFAARQTEWPASAVGRELFAMPSMAAAEPVGTPCANTSTSAPLASGVGTPSLGNTGFALQVSGTASTLAALAVGFPANQSTAPCELRFQNQIFALLTVTNGQGNGQLGVAIPSATAFAGMRLLAQWGVFESGGPYLGLAALSNGVDLVIAAQ